MAYFTPSAFEWGIVAETVPGTTPATPAFMRFVHKEGDNINPTHDWYEVDVVRQNRASNGGRRTNIAAEGSLSTVFQRGPANEALLLAASGAGAFASNIARGGNAETSFTIEKTLSATSYQRMTGAMVTGWNLEASYDGGVEVSVDIMGRGITNAATKITGATTGPAPSTQFLTGREITGVSLGGLSGMTYTSMSLSITQDRETINGFGTNAALGVAATSNRKISGSVTFHREDFTPETLLGDAAVPFSFTMGAAANGLTILLPAVFCKMPTDDTDGAKLYCTVEFEADWDATEATDIKITRLA